MNRLEYTDDMEETLRTLIDSRLQAVWTALPCIVQEYDASRCMCTVVPAMTIKYQPEEAGEVEEIRLPDLFDLPVVWPGGGNYFATFPLKQGDSVLAVFASRCIDGWWSEGGVQPQPEIRSHDLSDGFVLPMCFDRKSVPQHISTDSAELRSLSADQMVRLSNDGITLKNGATVIAQLTNDKIEMKAGVGAITIQGANISITGNLSVTGDVKAGAVSLTTHTHQFTDITPTGPATSNTLTPR